jgi:hypothetical protein
MKQILMLLAAALPALAQQPFDIKLLDRLGTNAKEATNISLDASLLKLASGFLGNDKDADAVKAIVGNLRGLYVRSFEFDGTGKYNVADLEPLRAFLRVGRWNKIVDVKSTTESSEIYMLALPDSKVGGVAIITAEPTEVTVVYIDGVISADDVQKLGGKLGIPDITIMTNPKKPETPKKEE